jgi:hypothetical protein
MNKLLVGLISVFPLIANAQINVCSVPEPYIVKYYNEIGLAQGTLQCGPPPRGLGVNPTLRGNGAGVMWWHYCKYTDGTYHPTFEFIAAYNAPDMLGGITAFAKKYYNVPLTNTPELAVFCAFQKEMYFSTPGVNPPPPPPAYTEFVKPNGLNTWRYTFPVDPATGKRSLTYNGKVDVGVPCDGKVRKIIELNVNTWEAFGPLFNPNVVTLCAPTAP